MRTAQPDRDSGDTRSRILAAAAHLFAQKGYAAATLDEVAHAAGLTKGAIYWNFRNKADLFFALLDDQFARHTAPLPEEIRAAAATGNPRTATAALMRATLARARENPDWPRLFLEFLSQTRDPEIQARLARFFDDTRREAVRYIGMMQAAGLVPSQQDPAVLAHFFASLVDGLLLSWIVNPNLVDLDSLTDRIVDLVWQGIAPAGAPDNKA